MLPRVLAALLVLSACEAARAQDVCYQENGGPEFNDGVFNGPNGTNAVKLTLTDPLVVGGVQIFTGETPGPATVAIWSQDDVHDKPGAKLAEAGFAVTTPDGWQGGSFAAPLALAAGSTYWVAWTLPFAAQSSIDSPKQTLGQFYRTSVDGGATWFGPFEFNNNHFKFRLIGGCGPCAGFTSAYGKGTAGAGLPTLLAGGAPCASHALALSVGHAPPLAPALLTLGLGVGLGTVKGCLLQNLPLAPVVVPFPIGAGGTALLTGELPAALPPGVINAQVLIADPAAPLGASATNPVQIMLG